MMRTEWAALAVFWVMLPATAMAAGSLTYQPAGTAALAGLLVGDFKPGTLDRGPIDAQTPAVRRLVTGLSVSISAGSDSGCGDSEDARLALALPNGSPAVTADCIFAAGLSITTERGPQQIGAQCDAWHNDLSVCSMDGDTGAFTLRRHTPDGAALDVIFGLNPDADQPTASVTPLGPPASGDVAGPLAAPSRAVLLGSVFDDEGRAIFDAWLLPQSEVTVALKRE